MPDIKQKRAFQLDRYEQLKAISDPLRIRMLLHLIERAYTGQQLAKKLEHSRSRIHYHLGELEKNGLISLVRKEEKKGIVQKFYQAVAIDFYISDSLLPHVAELKQTRRYTIVEMLNRAKQRALMAPDEAFEMREGAHDTWSNLSMQAEYRLREDQFKEWLSRYRKLVSELDKLQDEAGEYGKWYYLSSVGFQTEEKTEISGCVVEDEIGPQTEPTSSGRP
ncbi:winged helix-turn-helix domain-containing protein [Mechercharimyces sp. CAU 1602]|uniref:ArsR/SmtB family transcription factor n=1 Tax=Mechercharimyces sp. CAU 1602 TaxID=2973933 RepID=UPI0021618EA3|nr:winged helix-turn-helix domain-containing protein [Mechercharimyces sp. CAU 1602]MCS1352153.1 winged helix-turn-helix domain-containing protein [Mechercharimyces sp. CAU 1602]